VKLAPALIAAVGLCAAGRAVAFSPAELMHLLADVQASRAHFIETRHSAMLKQPLTLSGRLVYRRPNRLEKHVQTPFVETITIEGSRVTVARGGGADTDRVITLPAGGTAQALIESLRATLAGDLPALERHFAVAVTGSRSAWSMSLTPRAATLPVVRVDFSGKDSRIHRIEVLESGGDRTVTTISDEVR
jgi:outer membrane lipoprotein-sorting protein